MKKRFIACIIACAMLLMGTGYAYWTDTITLKTNVDTGDLQVKFTNAKYVDQTDDFTIKDSRGRDQELALDSSITQSKGEGETSVSGTDEIKISVHKLYPGNAQNFEVRADNVGTLAAKLGKITTDISGLGNNSALKDMLGVNIRAFVEGKLYYLCYEVGYGWRWVIDVPSRSEKNTFQIDGKNYVRLSDKDLESISNASDKFDPNEFLKLDCSVGKDLSVDNYFMIYISIGMDPDSQGSYTSGSSWCDDKDKVPATDDVTEAEAGFVKFNFVWDQYNAH